MKLASTFKYSLETSIEMAAIAVSGKTGSLGISFTGIPYANSVRVSELESKDRPCCDHKMDDGTLVQVPVKVGDLVQHWRAKLSSDGKLEFNLAVLWAWYTHVKLPPFLEAAQVAQLKGVVQSLNLDLAFESTFVSPDKVPVEARAVAGARIPGFETAPEALLALLSFEQVYNACTPEERLEWLEVPTDQSAQTLLDAIKSSNPAYEALQLPVISEAERCEFRVQLPMVISRGTPLGKPHCVKDVLIPAYYPLFVDVDFASMTRDLLVAGFELDKLPADPEDALYKRFFAICKRNAAQADAGKAHYRDQNRASRRSDTEVPYGNSLETVVHQPSRLDSLLSTPPSRLG